MNCRYYLKNLPRLFTRNITRIFYRDCSSKSGVSVCTSGTDKSNLHYRIVVVRQSDGRISWKNYTGSFVMVGQSICDIVSEDLSTTTIYAPVTGLIANRFVNEGSYISGETLICLIKVCERTTQKIDIESYIKKKKLYYQLSELYVDEDLLEDLEKAPIKRIQSKDFIAPRADVFLDDAEEDEADTLSKKRDLDKLSELLDKRRKEQFEKYTPDHLKEEIKIIKLDDSMISSYPIETFPTDKISGEIFQNLILENFTPIVNESLHIINDGMRIRYLTASIDIDLTNAIQMVLNEGSRNNLKFVLKFFFLTATIYALKEIPTLISTNDRSINITVGFRSKNLLAFPLLRNLDVMTHSDIRKKLLSIEKTLSQGQHLKDISVMPSDQECLAITNEWDFGNLSAPPCLYVSKNASLSLNTIIVKPIISQNYEITFAPIMSVYLLFNNAKIHGQDAYLFLNKLKYCMEELHHLSVN